MYCPKCGKQIADDSLFCTECGEKLQVNESFGVAAPLVGGQMPVQAMPVKKKKTKIGIIIALCLAICIIAVVLVLFFGGIGSSGSDSGMESLIGNIIGSSVLPNGVQFGDSYEQVMKKDSGVEQDGKSSHANADVDGSIPKTIFGIARSELYESMSKLTYNFDSEGKLSSVMFGLFFKSSEASDAAEQYMRSTFTIMPTKRDGYIWGGDERTHTVVMFEHDGDTMIGSLWYYEGESFLS